jgi:hypothetical protein
MSWRGALLVLTTALTVRFGITSNRDWLGIASTHQVEHTYQVLVAAENLHSVQMRFQPAGLLADGERRYLAPYGCVIPHYRKRGEIAGTLADNPRRWPASSR